MTSMKYLQHSRNSGTVQLLILLKKTYDPSENMATRHECEPFVCS